MPNTTSSFTSWRNLVNEATKRPQEGGKNTTSSSQADQNPYNGVIGAPKSSYR